jgi:predicted dehydrogenase
VTTDARSALSAVRLGVVGAGGIARAEHLPRFRRIDGLNIVGVANRTAESSAAVAAAEAIPRAYDSWQELVADRSIDAVLVATRPDQHAAVTIAALGAGKHVLTEARMAATLDDASAMLAAASSHPDLVAMLVPASFADWADRTIRRLLTESVVGPVRHVRVQWDAAGSVAPSEFWRWQRAWSGVNVMALGILVEVLQRWLGDATAASATSRILRPRKPGPDGEVDTDIADHLLVNLEFGDVTAATEMSIVSVIGGSRIVIAGDARAIEVELGEQAITIVDRDGNRSLVDIRAEDRDEWTAEIDFVSAIRGGLPGTLTDFATGVRYMAVVDAVDRAARSGRRVAIAKRRSGPSRRTWA